MREHSRAIADFTEAIRLDPKLGSAYRGRGNAYSATGEIDRADSDFSAAKQLGF
jgi:Flp pilus assembly protein TadD